MAPASLSVRRFKTVRAETIKLSMQTGGDWGQVSRALISQYSGQAPRKPSETANARMKTDGLNKSQYSSTGEHYDLPSLHRSHHWRGLTT